MNLTIGKIFIAIVFFGLLGLYLTTLKEYSILRSVCGQGSITVSSPFQYKRHQKIDIDCSKFNIHRYAAPDGYIGARRDFKISASSLWGVSTFISFHGTGIIIVWIIKNGVVCAKEMESGTGGFNISLACK